MILNKNSGLAWVAALCALAAVLGLWEPPQAHAVRIKDLAHIQGVRSNKLYGYGLVIGLQNSGDSQNTRFTVQSVASMLARQGVRVPAGSMQVRNVAAVIVTAELPPFAREGDRLDVNVASMGDARSLAGGLLVMTPLKGPDDKVYALAQGSLSTGGVNVEAQGSSVQQGFPNSARVANGAIVEKEVELNWSKRGDITVVLREADFTTASRVATAINLALGNELALAKDGGTVSVRVPSSYKGRAADFVAAIERIDVVPDRKARIVINERTGTIIVGEEVQISTVAISHGTLTIEVRQSNELIQPYPFSLGTTGGQQNADVEIREDTKKLTVLKGGVSIGELAQALSSMGASPRDLTAIFHALKGAGALSAELVIQ
jgi:flagellar P-ring protein precursor FlgI